MAEAEPEFTVKFVKGKAVYTRVKPKEETAPPLKAVTAPKMTLGCRGRYNAYVKKRAGKTTISLQKWAQINC